MQKNYIVRLTNEERTTCLAIIKKLKGSSQKVRRANILLNADADGPNWTDQDIADAFLCSRQCVENLRKRLVTEGFDIALNGKQRETPPRAKCFNGRQEAEVIALRLSPLPKDATAGRFVSLPTKLSNSKSLRKRVGRQSGVL